jgi:hypothetical protein
MLVRKRTGGKPPNQADPFRDCERQVWGMSRIATDGSDRLLWVESRRSGAIQRQALSQEIQIKRAARLKAQTENAGLRSANRKLKALMLMARAETEKLELKTEDQPAPGC